MSDEEVISLAINFAFTIFIYMLIPFTLFVTKKKFTNKGLIIFVILNSICSYIVCTLISLALGGTEPLNPYPMALYGYLNYLLLKRFTIKKVNDNKIVNKKETTKEFNKEHKISKDVKKEDIKEEKDIPTKNDIVQQEMPKNKESVINNKIFYIIALLIIILILIFISGYYIYGSYIEMKEDLDAKEARNSYLKKENESLKTDIKHLEKYREQSYYMNKHVAICTDETNLYHAYGCEDINDSNSIYIYNTENAIAQGYKAHSCVKKAPTSNGEDLINQIVDGTYKER